MNDENREGVNESASSEISQDKAPLTVYREIVQQAPLSIWASLGVEDDYKLVAWNDGAAEVYGHSADYAIGKNYLDLIISDLEREDSASDCGQIISEGRVYRNFLATDEASDGSERVMLTNCFRVFHPVLGKHLQVEIALDVSEADLFSDEERRHRELREIASVKKQTRRQLEAGTEINDLKLKISRLTRVLHETGKMLSYVERSGIGLNEITREDIDRLIKRVDRNIREEHDSKV